MGVERSVTCWHAQRQIILNEIVLLESQLRHMSVSVSLVNVQTANMPDARIAELLQQLVKAREKLSSLGPCPKPMMG